MFDMPASGRPGVHVIVVLHGEFTFPYRNMQQSPESDRPHFALRFNLTAGAPVLPPPTEEQAQQRVRGLPAAGALAVAPPFAEIGQPVMVSRGGFPPGQRYSPAVTTIIGNRLGGRRRDQSSRPRAEAVAAPSGRVRLH